MEAFSKNWFVMYYLGLGVLLLGSGFGLMTYYQKVRDYLVDEAGNEKPPEAIRNILKYFFYFTIPCLALSFIPFSWTELLFSVWSSCIVYFTGIQLVRWKQTRIVIQQNPDILQKYIRLTGAIMLAVSLVMFTLGYLAIN